MEGRNTPRSSASEMKDSLEDSHCDRTIQRSHVRPGFIEPLDPVRRHLLRSGNVFRRKSELRQDVFHRNALAAPCGKPLTTAAKTLPILGCNGLIVVWRRG